MIALQTEKEKIASVYEGFDEIKYNFFVIDSDQEGKRDSKTKNKEKEEKERYILCGHCKNKITLPLYRLEIHGSYEHTFLNPSGQVFHIGCFEKADGCISVGEFTQEWTWFYGFSWQASLCGQCLRHLGWYYSAKLGQSFFGLILDALI